MRRRKIKLCCYSILTYQVIIIVPTTTTVVVVVSTLSVPLSNRRYSLDTALTVPTTLLHSILFAALGFQLFTTLLLRSVSTLSNHLSYGESSYLAATIWIVS